MLIHKEEILFSTYPCLQSLSLFSPYSARQTMFHISPSSVNLDRIDNPPMEQVHYVGLQLHYNTGILLLLRASSFLYEQIA